MMKNFKHCYHFQINEIFLSPTPVRKKKKVFILILITIYHSNHNELQNKNARIFAYLEITDLTKKTIAVWVKARNMHML